jgi:hypothetical protein
MLRVGFILAITALWLSWTAFRKMPRNMNSSVGAVPKAQPWQPWKSSGYPGFLQDKGFEKCALAPGISARMAAGIILEDMDKKVQRESFKKGKSNAD